MRVGVLCVLATLFLGGCALPRGINSPETVANIKSVALVVAIDDTISLGYVGLTVFNNKQETVPVDWNVTARVREHMEKYLRPRYEIVPFSYDPAFFKDAHTSSDATMGTATEVTKRLKEIAKPGTADAFVVAVYGASGWVSSNRQGNFVGTGFTMTVFDGRTIEPIAQAYGGVACARPICLNGFDRPVRKVDFRWEGAPYVSLPTATRDHIRSIVFELLDQAVPNTLGRLKLIPAQISGATSESTKKISTRDLG